MSSTCIFRLDQHNMVYVVIGVRDHFVGGGGAGGVLRCCLDGGARLKPPNQYPIFKGHFGGKGYPSLGIFSQENDVFVYFSDEMGENI